jgi:hypothetical protein
MRLRAQRLLSGRAGVGKGARGPVTFGASRRRRQADHAGSASCLSVSGPSVSTDMRFRRLPFRRRQTARRPEGAAGPTRPGAGLIARG